MPVDYQAPGAIGLAALYGRGGGGGYGGGGGGPIQQLHDDTGRQQNQLAALGLQGRIESDQMNQRANAQAALQTHAAEMDAWQYHQRVTEQEQMQRRQDDNAIAAIDQDNTMSPVEKLQAKTRIRSRIDWVDQRQKRDMQEAQAQMYKAHASQFEADADLLRRKNTFDAQNMKGMSQVDIDENRLPELKSYMEDAHSDLIPGSPEYQSKLQERSLQIGAGRKYVLDPKTGGKIADPYELERLKHRWSASSGSPSGALSGTSGGAQADQSVGQANKDYWEAIDKATKVLGPGSDAKAIKSLADELLVGHGEHLAKYQQGTPQGRLVEAKKVADQVSFGIGQQIGDVNKMALPPEVKAPVLGILSKMRYLVDKYPPGESRPDGVQKKINDLETQFRAIEASPRWQALLKGGQPQQAADQQATGQQSGAERLIERLGNRDLVNTKDMPTSFMEGLQRAWEGRLVTPDTLQQWYERK